MIALRNNDVVNSSNKDLVDARDFLIGEFDKTKEIIIELTKQLESIEILYNNVNTDMLVQEDVGIFRINRNYYYDEFIKMVKEGTIVNVI
jgi:hypothetical protein